MKTFDEIETDVLKATELATASRFHEARALALQTHKHAFDAALGHKRDSIESGRAQLYMRSCNEVLRICTLNLGDATRT